MCGAHNYSADRSPISWDACCVRLRADPPQHKSRLTDRGARSTDKSPPGTHSVRPVSGLWFRWKKDGCSTAHLRPPITLLYGWSDARIKVEAIWQSVGRCGAQSVATQTRDVAPLISRCFDHAARW